MRVIPVTALLLVACGDTLVTKYNSPPEVAILLPADYAQVPPGATVEFIGLAGDQQSAPKDIDIVWTSTLDGELGSDPPDSDGNLYLAVNGLSPGTHVITLTAIDEEEESSNASITLDVTNNIDTDDTGVVPTGAPLIEIANPQNGGSYLSTEVINIIATITDDVDPGPALVAELLDVPDGLLWSGNPTMSGTVSVPWTFSEGSHTLSLSAIDTEGYTSTEEVSFTVADGTRPVVSIDDPADGATYNLTDVITFRGTVSDDLTAAQDLGVVWSSDIGGVLSTNPSNGSGTTVFASALGGGTHTITLAATDEEGKEGRDTIVVTVDDPNAIDDDGDGWSENEGDCDDANPLLNPGATDICDGEDNNCDGIVNDDWFDTYEINDSMSTAAEIGEVGEILFLSSSMTISGLTLSSDVDEDWFQFEVDDIWIFLDISISASGLPSTGGARYVMELYSVDDGVVIQSTSGTTSLNLNFSTTIFSDYGNDFAVRIYATTWSGSCSDDYNFTITS